VLFPLPLNSFPNVHSLSPTRVIINVIEYNENYSLCIEKYIKISIDRPIKIIIIFLLVGCDGRQKKRLDPGKESQPQ
jgi:hypothetical protein